MKLISLPILPAFCEFKDVEGTDVGEGDNEKNRLECKKRSGAGGGGQRGRGGGTSISTGGGGASTSTGGGGASTSAGGGNVGTGGRKSYAAGSISNRSFDFRLLFRGFFLRVCCTVSLKDKIAAFVLLLTYKRFFHCKHLHFKTLLLRQHLGKIL